MEYATGAHESPYDVRTFAYQPTGVAVSGGKRYNPEDIEHQHKVGICTAISLTQQARKATGMKFSADFQYLMQKMLEGNWDEGSSLSTSLKVSRNIGLLPADKWTFTTEADRSLPYAQYIAKLKAVPAGEIERLKVIAGWYKITAYERIDLTPALMKQAINESQAGILCRFEVGEEWYTGQIEPLRKPLVVISGHGITMSNHDGDSFRDANTWGKDWADKGTAYSLFSKYMPTEAWLVHYGEAPEHVQDQLAMRTALQGQLLDLLQKLLVMLKITEK